MKNKARCVKWGAILAPSASRRRNDGPPMVPPPQRGDGDYGARGVKEVRTASQASSEPMRPRAMASSAGFSISLVVTVKRVSPSLMVWKGWMA